MTTGLTAGPPISRRLIENDFRDRRQEAATLSMSDPQQLSSALKSHVSPSRGHSHTSRSLSRQSSSSDLSSEAAQEITVWTEEMDVDDNESHGNETDSLSEMDITKYVEHPHSISQPFSSIRPPCPAVPFLILADIETDVVHSATTSLPTMRRLNCPPPTMWGQSTLLRLPCRCCRISRTSRRYPHLPPARLPPLSMQKGRATRRLRSLPGPRRPSTRPTTMMWNV